MRANALKGTETISPLDRGAVLASKSKGIAGRAKERMLITKVCLAGHGTRKAYIEHNTADFPPRPLVLYQSLYLAVAPRCYVNALKLTPSSSAPPTPDSM